MNQARVLALIEDMDGPALWRVLNPFAELERQGYEGIMWDFSQNKYIDNLFYIENWVKYHFDALILPRIHYEKKDTLKAAEWFRRLHEKGIVLIYELDDDLFSEDFERRLMEVRGHKKWSAYNRLANIMNTIRQCDGMTVSCQRLATMARQYVDMPVKVVENYIDLHWFKEIQEMNQEWLEGLNINGNYWYGKGITIGWAGGARPDTDLDNMAQAWGRIAERYDNVQFVVYGHQPQVIYEHVPLDRIRPLKWMPIKAYPIGFMTFDIGCCPLQSTKFNRAKTPIKAMEYAASGAAVVASPTVYHQVIEHGKDGYLVETADEWEGALSELVEKEDRRRELADALMDKVKREYSLEDNAWRFVTAWSAIVEEYRQKHPVKPPAILIPDGVKYERWQ